MSSPSPFKRGPGAWLLILIALVALAENAIALQPGDPPYVVSKTRVRQHKVTTPTQPAP